MLTKRRGQPRRHAAFRIFPVVIAAAAGVLGCTSNELPRAEGDVPLGRELNQVLLIGADPRGVGFSDVRGYATDADGRIWVIEWDAHLHHFEPDGTHIRTWARGGEGPAEFGSVTAFALDRASGRMAVRAGSRITVVTAELEEVGRWLVPQAAGVNNFSATLHFHPEGSGVLYAVPHRRDAVTRGDREVSWSTGPLLRTDLEGVVLDTVAELVGGWVWGAPGARGVGNQTWRGREVWHPLPDGGMLLGDGHTTYAIQRVSAAGDTLRTFRRSPETEPLPDWDGPELMRGYVTDVLFDPHRQEMLLCRTRPWGIGPLDPVMVDYFAIEGAYLGSLEWPGCPRHVSADGTLFAVLLDSRRVPTLGAYRYLGEELWTVELDDLDVPWLVRYRLHQE